MAVGLLRAPAVVRGRWRGRVQRRRAQRAPLRAAAAADGDAGAEPKPPTLAPLAPTSPEGEFLTHILDQEPHLFQPAVDQQLERLAQEKQAAEAEAGGAGGGGADPEGASLVLYRRIEEVRRSQRQRSVQDLMYASVLHKFVALGVDLLPPLDGAFDIRPVDLNALTKGVHTPEALDMVKEHLYSVLGGQPPPFANTMVRISKLQGAQVYAASVMFGYFVRRVDRNFQLERSLGTLRYAKSEEETLEALEELFAAADAADSIDAAGMEVDIDPDAPEPSQPKEQGSQRGALRAYVEQFDPETLARTATIVSKEGLALAERQTGALFGKLEDLQREMQQAIEQMGDGKEIESAEELMARVKDAVESEAVQTLTLPYATQRRIVLEAVAFGAFLRDVEAYVDDYALLTPISSASKPPPAA